MNGLSGLRKLGVTPPKRTSASQAQVAAAQRLATHMLLTSLLKADIRLYFNLETGRRLPILGQFAVIEPLLPEQINTTNPQESFVAAIQKQLDDLRENHM